MTRALLGVACALALACAGAPEMPPGALSSEQAQKIILERDDVRDALAARERELAGEIAALQAEIADLRSQLGLAQESAAQAATRAMQYEAGLGRAVEELNQVSQEAATAAKVRAYRVADATRSASRPRGNVTYYTDPNLSIVGGSVAASGRLYNDGDAEANGTLIVELIGNGDVLATKSQPLRVNQRSWATWQESFEITPRGEHLSVIARLEF